MSRGDLATRLAVVAAAWIAAVVASTLFVLPGYPLTLMWAPMGVALAGLLWIGPRALTVLVPGAALVGLLLDASLAARIATAVGLVSGPCTAKAMLGRVGFSPTFARGFDAIAFAVAAGAGAGVAALAAFGGLVWGEHIAAYKAMTIAQTWWMSDLVGYVAIVPPALVVMHRETMPIPRIHMGAYITGIVLAAGLAHLSFNVLEGAGYAQDQLAVLLLATHVIITMACGLAYGAFAIGIVVALMAIDVALGSAAESQSALLGRVSWFYSFASTNALVNLVLGAALRERRAAEDELAFAKAAVDTAGDAMLWAGLDGRIGYANAAARRLVGFDPADGQTMMTALDESLTPELLRELAAAPADETLHVRALFRREDGTSVNVELACSVVRRASRTMLTILARDITARVAQEQALTWEATHDALTGLSNRTAALNNVAARFERREEGARFALLFVDLNRFKQVNDVHGHAAGDELLIQVAARLRACVREDDMVARLGGDEFLIIISGTDDEVVVERAQHRMREALEEPFALEAATVSVSASIGAARSSDEHADAESMIERADAAMYRQKRQSNDSPAVASNGDEPRATDDASATVA